MNLYGLEVSLALMYLGCVGEETASVAAVGANIGKDLGYNFRQRGSSRFGVDEGGSHLFTVQLA